MLRAVVVAALVPTPIGVGPRYHPAAGTHGPCVPSPLQAGRRVHVELFAERRVVIVPAGIGLRGPQFRFGRAASARCRAPLWTGDPTGVVRYEGTHRLGDLFEVWGRQLGTARLLGFRGRVHLYRNGTEVIGDPRRLLMHRHDELVLEVGGYVAPHGSYAFPR